jgi:hypothetical protein
VIHKRVSPEIIEKLKAVPNVHNVKV